MSQFAVWYYVVGLREKVMHENNFARLERHLYIDRKKH
jgi:hypothetical protein